MIDLHTAVRGMPPVWTPAIEESDVRSSPDNVRQPALPLSMPQDVLHVVDLQAPPARTCLPQNLFSMSESCSHQVIRIRISCCSFYVATQYSRAGALLEAAAPVLQAVCYDMGMFIDELGRHRHEVRVRRIVYRAARRGSASRDAVLTDASPVLARNRAAACLPGCCLRAWADWAAMTHILRRQEGDCLPAQV